MPIANTWTCPLRFGKDFLWATNGQGTERYESLGLDLLSNGIRVIRIRPCKLTYVKKRPRIDPHLPKLGPLAVQTSFLKPQNLASSSRNLLFKIHAIELIHEEPGVSHIFRVFSTGKKLNQIDP